MDILRHRILEGLCNLFWQDCRNTRVKMKLQFSPSLQQPKTQMLSSVSPTHFSVLFSVLSMMSICVVELRAVAHPF